MSTVGEEKRFNPRLAGKSREEFKTIMDHLNLPRPKYIDQAVPANKEGGLGMALEDKEGGFAEVSAQQAAGMLDEARVIDVREHHEFLGEMGHIPGAENVPMGEISQAAVDWRRDTPLLLVCRSGRRSRQVCATLAQRGYHNVTNLQGGMLEYRESGQPVEGA